MVLSVLSQITTESQQATAIHSIFARQSTMGNKASTVSTVVSARRTVNSSIRGINNSIPRGEAKVLDYCDQKDLKLRRKQREEAYRQKVKERQERKAKILAQFIANQRVHAVGSE